MLEKCQTKMYGLKMNALLENGDSLVPTVQDRTTGNPFDIPYRVCCIEGGKPDHDLVLRTGNIHGLLDVRVKEEVEVNSGLCADRIQAVDVENALIAPLARIHGPFSADFESCDL